MRQTTGVDEYFNLFLYDSLYSNDGVKAAINFTGNVGMIYKNRSKIIVHTQLITIQKEKQR